MRVPELHAFRSAIRTLVAPSSGPGVTRFAPLVVVPTRGAAHHLALTIARDARPVTREELYDELHARLDDPPRRLAALERDVIAQASARAAAGRHPDLAFRLRPGLVAEMLRFYDQLRRQSQQVKRFEELLADALGGDDIDRAAARMRVQTAFLADAFRDYERRAAALGVDEHALRERLIAEAAAEPVRQVVVTIADWIADADGLYLADFDLLTRIPGLEQLDIVCTERVLGSGFFDRLHNWWPGLEELTPPQLGIRDASPAPVIVTPPVTTTHQPPVTPGPESPIPHPQEMWWTLRDREEELVMVARWLDADARRDERVPLERTAVVYKHPLPYLYAAAGVFRSAALPYQSYDTLPLAAEPTAAALDLVFEAVASNFTRASLVALLRSPHFLFADDGVEVTREAVSAFDRFLSRSRYLGDLERLEALGRIDPDGTRSAQPGRHLEALNVALAAARELAPLLAPSPASAQLTRVLAFWRGHQRPLADDDPFAARERRSRAAIDDILSRLAQAHAAHDDPLWVAADAGIAVRRRIEEHTFVPDNAGRGIHLVDAQAARYGDFDDLVVVGVTDTDWPERTRRNIFYPPSLLKALGWPSERDRRAADDARFLDLIASAARRTALTTITLEDDALVSRSLQLDEVPRARLTAIAREAAATERIFADEALSLEPMDLARFEGTPRAWAERRAARSPADSPAYHGTIASVPARAWSVSALETYLDCPFKFFAQHVLALEEEPDDEEVMDPRRQGRFVHQVFERFFREWQDSGGRAITVANLDAARRRFADVVDRALAELPEAEAGLERTRLLGSPAAAGLGEAVFRMEAERPVAVVERLLEKELSGEFTFDAGDGPRRVSLRGKADRIDLLADGTFRLIDYKLGWPPQRTRALQLPIYSLCAEQRLESHRGRRWTLGEAAYLAFKGPRRVVPLFSAADRAKVLADAQQRLIETLAAIDRGEFPPTPDDVWRCDTCTFSSVCRKDYIGDV